jgi:hypothetical protein
MKILLINGIKAGKTSRTLDIDKNKQEPEMTPQRGSSGNGVEVRAGACSLFFTLRAQHNSLAFAATHPL